MVKGLFVGVLKGGKGMSTSILTFALAGVLLAGQSNAPTWESSYGQAQQRSASMQKPMAVFLGFGPNGWSQVVRDGAPSAQISQILGEKYLCVYIDMTTPHGMKLAQAFAIDGEPGVVLSNATGDSQAFWHAGKMTNPGLARYLQKYANPRVALNGTELADAAATGSPALAAITPARSGNSSTPMRTSQTEVQGVSNSTVAAPVAAAAEKVKAPAEKVVAPTEKVVAPTEKVVAPVNLTWQPTYLQGQKVSADTKKPLAVAFGSGANGWTKVVRDAAPSAEVTQVLAKEYVCVFVDTATPDGQKLAQDFSIMQGPGIVLSDRTGTKQAFWHQGDMTNQSIAGYLTKYADPQIVVRSTETPSAARTSYYPAMEAESTWGVSGSPSSYCPSCGNARGRR
jgi:hypothetical protein